MNKLQVLKLDPEAEMPSRAHPTDAGLDLYSLTHHFLPKGQTLKIPTGVAIKIPVGMVGKIEDRSGLASKGLRTGAGIVDSSYSGDITIVLHNLNNKEDFHEGSFGKFIEKGSKIAQLLLYKVETPEVEEVKELWSSQRGNKGFGSSGN